MKSIQRIIIDFIPQSEQRYETVGDWFYSDDETLVLKISKMDDERHEQLIAVHELVEALVCNIHEVSQEAVDAFDMGAGKDLDDPGDSPDAPYHAEHMLASAVERIMASAFGADWEEYERAIEKSFA